MESRAIPIALVLAAAASILLAVYWPSSGTTVKDRDVAGLHIRGDGELAMEGDVIPDRNHSLRGWVDGLTVDPTTITIRGWSGDVSSGRPAAGILVFLNGRLATRGTTGVSRGDVAQAWKHPSLTTAGFLIAVPFADAAQSRPVVRLFALDRSGHVNELEYSPSIPLPHP